MRIRTARFSRNIFFTLITSVMLSSVSAFACDIQGFQSRDFGELTNAEKTFRLDTMSEQEFEKAKSESGGSIKFMGFTLGGSYDEMKETVREVKRASSFSNEKRFHKAWEQSLLSDNGLKAYLGCLRSNQGFHVVTETLEKSDFKLRLIWTPGGAAGVPSIPDTLNITTKSIAKLKAQIGSKPWGRQNYDLETFMQRLNTANSSQVTVRLDNKSYVLYLPSIPNIVTPIFWDYNTANPDTHFRCKGNNEIINELHDCNAHGICGDTLAIRAWCKRKYSK